MGWGDELIVTGQARELHERDPARGLVVIRDRHGRARSHEMWRNNPHIADRNARISGKWHEVVNGPGARPYIAAKGDTKWTWREFACPRGEIYFDGSELAWAKEFAGEVIIEPAIKQKASPNKDWGRNNWIALIRVMRDAGLRPVQLGAAGTQVLAGARLIETPTFRHACAVVSTARGCVLPEGGLHHAAACFRTPAVVIFGGYISPKQTGYDDQVNLFTGGQPCGMRVPCAHCHAAMGMITVATVMDRLMGILR